MVFICTINDGVIISDNIEIMQGEHNANSIMIEGLENIGLAEVYIDFSLPKNRKYRVLVDKNSDGKYEYKFNNTITKHYGIINFDIVLISGNETVAKYQAVKNIFVKKAVNADIAIIEDNISIIDKLIADNADSREKIKENFETLSLTKEDKYTTVYNMTSSQSDLGYPQGIKAGIDPIKIDLNAYKKVKIFFKSASAEITAHIMDIEAASVYARDKIAVCTKNNASIWYEDNMWKYHNKIATVYYNTATKMLEYRGAGYLNYNFSNNTFVYNDRSIKGIWPEDYVICKMEGLK